MAASELDVRAPRRSLVASGASIGLHGAVVIVAVALTSRAVTQSPRRILTDIEVVDAVAVPAPLTAAPAPVAPSPEPTAVAHSRRSPTPVPRAPRPPAATDVRTDLAVSYDDPDNFRGDHPSDAPSDGERAPRSLGVAASVDSRIDTGVARLEMPVPTAVSMARPARPLHDYRKLHLTSVRQFAGQSIRVRLSIDATGTVTDVQIVQGIESHLDERTIALTRAFKFAPALDEVGSPVASTSKWEILIVDEAKESIKGNLERGFY